MATNHEIFCLEDNGGRTPLSVHCDKTNAKLKHVFTCTIFSVL